ncbi:MAG: helix-turn-helix domain-containing protein [bacterium]
MSNDTYLSLKEVADIMGISRIAVYKKVKKGEIKAERIGRSFAVKKSEIVGQSDRKLEDRDKKEIDLAIKKTINEYGEALKQLGSL